MLQSMGLQRVGHDLVTEQQQISVKGFPKIKHCRLGSIKNCFVPTEGSFFFSHSYFSAYHLLSPCAKT